MVDLPSNKRTGMSIENETHFDKIQVISVRIEVAFEQILSRNKKKKKKKKVVAKACTFAVGLAFAAYLARTALPQRRNRNSKV